MSTLTLPNGTALTQVTRASVLARIASIPLHSYEYSQTRVEPSTGRRADCTGWVAYGLASPRTGPGTYLNAHNTGSFYTQKLIERIDWSELKPGDLVGYFAASSPGNGGHAAFWLAGDRAPNGRFQISDHGSGWGPKLRWVRWDGRYTGGWMDPGHIGAWRYVGITETEGDDMPSVDEVARAVWAYPISSPGLGMAARPAADWLKDATALRQQLAPKLAEILAAALDDGDAAVVLAPEALAKLEEMHRLLVAAPEATADAVIAEIAS